MYQQTWINIICQDVSIRQIQIQWALQWTLLRERMKIRRLIQIRIYLTIMTAQMSIWRFITQRASIMCLTRQKAKLPETCSIRKNKLQSERMILPMINGRIHTLKRQRSRLKIILERISLQSMRATGMDRNFYLLGLVWLRRESLMRMVSG